MLAKKLAKKAQPKPIFRFEIGVLTPRTDATYKARVTSRRRSLFQ